ncbi:MAG: glycosyltransferase family 4 protein [Fulvivirga sp.]
MYPDAFVSYGYANEKSWLIKFWRFLNTKAYTHAENIYTISNSMSNKLKDVGHVVKTIPMWADTHSIKPINKEANWFRNELQLNEKFVVLYSGNFGETHDLESVIQAAIDLKDIDYIHFLFIGDGKKKKMLRSKIKDYNLTNVKVLPFQNEQKFPYSITSGDVSIVTLDEKAAELSVPSKVFYYMAAGSAIITVSHPKSELAQLVEKYSCGFNISGGRQMKLADCIIKLSKDSGLLEDLKQNSRRASKFHSPDNVKNIVI